MCVFSQKHPWKRCVAYHRCNRRAIKLEPQTYLHGKSSRDGGQVLKIQFQLFPASQAHCAELPKGLKAFRGGGGICNRKSAAVNRGTCSGGGSWLKKTPDYKMARGSTSKQWREKIQWAKRQHLESRDHAGLAEASDSLPDGEQKGRNGTMDVVAAGVNGTVILSSFFFGFVVYFHRKQFTLALYSGRWNINSSIREYICHHSPP